MKTLVRPVILVLAFVFCVGLLGYAWMVFQMSRGVAAAREGEVEMATAIFGAAEKPFLTIPWLARLLKYDYETLIFNQAKVLATGEDPELIVEKFETAARHSPSIKEQGEYAFWMGNLLVRRAAASRDGEEALRYLKAALAEYQRGLVSAPDDWDLKYNYELVSRLFAQQQRAMKAQSEKVKSILDKTRPAPTKQLQVAPEKLG